MTAVGVSAHGTLLLTRERGRKVAETLPRRREVVLDFTGVEAASPSFLHELLVALLLRGTKTVTFQKVTPSIAENLRRISRLDQDGKRQPEVLVG